MRSFLLFLSLFFSIASFLLAKEPVRFCVVIPSYNNENWCIENLQSVACQKYPHWRAIYVNDASTDKTGALVDAYIASHKLENRFTVIHNKLRRGALYNTYHAIHMCHPNEVIVILDGDDKIIDGTVLNYVAKLYKKDPNLWLTYGNMISKPYPRRNVCREVPKSIIRRNDFRHFPYVSGHLRTFYAGLFHQIKKHDLMEEGHFFQSAGDVATMLPMLEMASKNHFKYVRRVLYVYRMNNPLNDFNNRPLQKRCSLVVRSRPSYKPLLKAPWKQD